MRWCVLLGVTLIPAIARAEHHRSRDRLRDRSDVGTMHRHPRGRRRRPVQRHRSRAAREAARQSKEREFSAPWRGRWMDVRGCGRETKAIRRWTRPAFRRPGDRRARDSPRLGAEAARHSAGARASRERRQVLTLKTALDMTTPVARSDELELRWPARRDIHRHDQRRRCSHAESTRASSEPSTLKLTPARPAGEAQAVALADSSTTS